jgi:hypothetical protein
VSSAFEMLVGMTKGRVNMINLNGSCSGCSVQFGCFFNNFHVRPEALGVARVEFKQKLSFFVRHKTSTNNAVFQHTRQRFTSLFS